MNNSSTALAATVAACVLMCLFGAASAAAQPFDHLTCYKVKDPQKFKGIVTLDALQDQFDLPASCKIKGKAKLFCVPTAKTVDEFIVGKQPGQLQQVPGPEAIPDRICYKVKCSAPQVTSELVSDQFGTRQLAGFKPFLLCTPAVKGLPPTSTTTTTVATTSTTLSSSCTTAADCDDGDACTIDTCVGGTCNHAPDPACCTASSECNDGNLCTTDACVAGMCSFTPKDCSALSGMCTTGVCDVATGQCISQPKPPTTACDDGDICTVADSCDGAGGCVGMPKDCNDNDSCTADTCVAAVGCTHSTLPDGSPCDDGDICTTVDVCTGGVCAGTVNPNCCQTASQCDDGDACTIDQCVANTCSHSVAPNGTPCTPVGGGQGVCQSGQCVPW